MFVYFVFELDLSLCKELFLDYDEQVETLRSILRNSLKSEISGVGIVTCSSDERHIDLFRLCELFFELELSLITFWIVFQLSF